jgi:hypothetical protein
MLLGNGPPLAIEINCKYLIGQVEEGGGGRILGVGHFEVNGVGVVGGGTGTFQVAVTPMGNGGLQ